MFGDTVTIYQHIKEGRSERWERNVYEGVMWQEEITKTVNSDGIIQVVKSVSITIPYDAKLEINAAGNLNIAVCGKCPAYITEDYTIADLQQHYKSAVIKSVTNNTNRGLLKNWKLVCV
ncbi:MAG: hypothetical protein Q4C00_01500 [Bacillota bacterium]|nr:hypothetical protein [Bacillota bacterium]